MSEKTKKGDFIEIKYSGYANNELFDSNFEEDLKKLNPKAKPFETIIAIGEHMVVSGLDNALEEKEIGKEYEAKISPKEGFGARHRELIKTIPLHAFTAQNVHPQAGMVLTLDNMMVKIMAVSGARVIADFNNPLAGKDIFYKFKIVRKVEDEKQKTSALFSYFFKFVPEFEIKEDKIVVKAKKSLEQFILAFSDKWKKMLNKPLAFEELKENKKESNEAKEKNKNEQGIREHNHQHDHVHEHPHAHSHDHAH